jgi:pimeloyl-ACP methyl ester carboxylesterase
MQTVTSKVQSPPTRRGNKLVVWLGRSLLGLLVLIVILALAGAVYQAIATAMDRRNYPAPGQMADVGGYKLHIYCVGDRREGNPTVILDAVGGGSSAQWALVQPEIAATTRVCAYDRAGLGWSELGPEPRDAHQQVRELRTLLANADVAGPYVLVGHSYGGRVARVYAAQYPDEVVGLVLVDTGQLYQDPRYPPEVQAEYAAEEQMIHTVRWLAPIGIARLLLTVGLGPAAEDYDLPAPQRAESKTFNATTKFWQSMVGQYEAMPETDVQERAVKSLGDMPLVVLSATLPADETRRAWNEFSAELAGLSSNSSHRLVDGATHMSLTLKQEHAQQTSAAILQVVEAARTGQPLVQE